MIKSLANKFEYQVNTELAKSQILKQLQKVMGQR